MKSLVKNILIKSFLIMVLCCFRESIFAQCRVIYVTPTGSSYYYGTINNPTNISSAISRAGANYIIKMSTGTYNLTNPLTLKDSITIEGGYNSTTWVKTSTPGATTINRTTTNPEGAAGQQRLVAFYANGVSGFRFQDITISTSNASQAGMSTYGLHLTNCSNYKIVRTQILPGNGGNGSNGLNGVSGARGGNGVLGGAGRDGCNGGCVAGGNGGNAGAGGGGGAGVINGTAGGAGGRGGNGANDCSTNAQNGFGSSCAAGGARGNNSSATTVAGAGSTCNANGANGNNGTNGTATIGAFFVPGNGTNGTRGNGGRGGGGGGGGGENTDGCNASGNGGSGGGGGGGGGGAAGLGTGGGASFAIFALSNGAGAQIIDSRLIGGTAGASGQGGTGGNGGLRGIGGAQQNSCTGCGRVNRGGRGGDGSAGGRGGNGGDGSAGISVGFRLSGSSPSIINNSSSTTLNTGNNNPVTFNLAAQNTITVDSTECTNLNIAYTSSSASTWDFDRVTNNATPATSGTSSSANTQYSQTGRYTLSGGSHIYTGFKNIIGESPTLANAGIDQSICNTSNSTNLNANAATRGEGQWYSLGTASLADSSLNTTSVSGLTSGSNRFEWRISSSCCGEFRDTVNVIVNDSSTFTDVHSVCDSLPWIDGNTYFNSTNTPVHRLTNAAGCDSVITLDLTVTNDQFTGISISSQNAPCGDSTVYSSGPTTTGAYNYTWSFTGGNPSTQSGTNLLTPDTVVYYLANSYPISLQISYGSCVYTDNAGVFVNCATLPVEIGDFNCALNLNRVNIDWLTYTEINNQHFELWRSTNGRDYKLIQTVNSQALFGNSNGNLEYNEVDYHLPNSAIIYYKLIQQDFDGKRKTLAIDVVENRSKVDEILFPNPFSDRLNISEFENVEKVEFYSMDGGLVAVFSGAEGYINTHSLKNGMYLVKVHSQFSTTQKILIKE